MCIKNIKYVTPWWWEGVFLEPQVACQRPSGQSLDLLQPAVWVWVTAHNALLPLWTLPPTSAPVVPSPPGTSFVCSFLLMLLSAGNDTSIRAIIHHCVWLVGQQDKSHRTSALLFSSTFGGVSHQNLETSNPCCALS